MSTTCAHACRGHLLGPPGGQNGGALRAPGHDDQQPGLLGRRQRVLVRGDPEEHGDLLLVAEQDVHVVEQEVEELPLVAPDAEGIGQRERDRPLGGVGGRRGVAHRLLGRRHVPQVALEQHDRGPGDEGRRDALGRHCGGGAEVGPHGAVGVVGDEDHAAAGAETVPGRRLAQVRLELDTRRPQVLGVGAADLVVGDGTDETGGAAQHGDSGRGVGHRPARDVTGRPHELLHGVGGRQVDQRHRPLLQADLGQLFLGRQLNHVEQRRTDGHDIEIVAVGIIDGQGFLGGHGARTYPRRRG